MRDDGFDPGGSEHKRDKQFFHCRGFSSGIISLIVQALREQLHYEERIRTDHTVSHTCTHLYCLRARTHRR